jgi:hypothetical protein
MLRKNKLLPVILAFIMALTITGQMPAFALEEDPQGQPEAKQEITEDTASEQNGAQEEQSQDQTAETEELQPEKVADEQAEETEQAVDDPEDSNAELQAMGGDIAAMGSVITASGLTKVTSPTSAKWDGKTIDISWYDPSKSTFTIDTGAKLAGLAALVNGSYDKTITKYSGTSTQLSYIECVKLDNFAFTGAGGGNTGGTCYKSLGKRDFMGKTIYITKDLDELNSRPQEGYTYTLVAEIARFNETDESRAVSVSTDLLYVRLGRTAYRGVKNEYAKDELEFTISDVLKAGVEVYCKNT